MSTYLKNQMEETWQSLWQTYFSPNSEIAPIRVKGVSESLAPFFFHSKRGGVMTMNQAALSLDIGGGTTDLVVFHDDSPKLLSSFRFAGDMLFGDGYNERPESNGFIQRFGLEPGALMSHDDKGQRPGKIYDEIIHRGRSSDVVNFLLSLDKNLGGASFEGYESIVKRIQRDGVMKYPVWVFVTAIFYYAIRLMQLKETPVPRYVLLSGAGSKILRLVDSNSKLSGFSDQFAQMYALITGNTVPKIEFRSLDDPKQATARGGLFIDRTMPDIATINNEWLGDSSGTVFNGTNRRIPLAEQRRYVKGVSEGYLEFLDHLNVLKNQFNLHDRFNMSINRFELVDSILREDIEEFILKGMQQQQDVAKDNRNEMHETMFFLPLIGTINRLAFRLATQGDEGIGS
jgi:hypothetical protein